jgi:hypothetical protein
MRVVPQTDHRIPSPSGAGPVVLWRTYRKKLPAIPNHPGRWLFLHCRGRAQGTCPRVLDSSTLSPCIECTPWRAIAIVHCEGLPPRRRQRRQRARSSVRIARCRGFRLVRKWSGMSSIVMWRCTVAGHVREEALHVDLAAGKRRCSPSSKLETWMRASFDLSRRMPPPDSPPPWRGGWCREQTKGR